MVVQEWELVGSYISSKINKVQKNETAGLYRNGGFGVFSRTSDSGIEKKKKCGFLFNANTNLKFEDFLDIQLNF